jgi:hypothetical protein
VAFTEERFAHAQHFFEKEIPQKFFPSLRKKIWTKLFLFITLVVGGAGVERVRERCVRRGGDL